MKKLRIFGIMSGTSLDGLDIASCLIEQNIDRYIYQIEKANTYKYPSDLKKKLAAAQQLSALDLLLLNNEVGKFIGNKVNEFIATEKIKPDYISSHGHTIYHQPEQGLTYQIGNPAEIYAETEITTIADFRTIDVALGGQGAPLVPIGDQLLFSEFDAKINFGGIANISYETNQQTIAYDICPVNMLLNYLTMELNLEYDDEGNIARSGKIDMDLLNEINNLDFFSIKPPKSLGLEWFEQNVLPVLQNNNSSVQDKLRTSVEHIANQISDSIRSAKKIKTVYVSGGGVYNHFLIERIREKLPKEITIHIPDKKEIEFKEALIFALLGYLRLHNQNNVLKSVTGARKDNIGGSIYGPII